MKRLLSSVWNFFEVEEIFYTLFVIAVLFVIPAFAVFTIGDALTYIAFFMPVIFLAGSALYGYFVGSRRGMKRKIMHAAAIAEAVVFIPVLFIEVVMVLDAIRRWRGISNYLFGSVIVNIIIAAVIFLLTYLPAWLGWKVGRICGDG